MSRIDQAERFAQFVWAGLIRLEWYAWFVWAGLIRRRVLSDLPELDWSVSEGVPNLPEQNFWSCSEKLCTSSSLIDQDPGSWEVYLLLPKPTPSSSPLLPPLGHDIICEHPCVPLTITGGRFLLRAFFPPSGLQINIENIRTCMKVLMYYVWRGYKILLAHGKHVIEIRSPMLPDL